MTAIHSKGDGLSRRYSCHHCQLDISAIVSIQCAECQNTDLCVDCFSEGVEFGCHQKTHMYRVVEPLAFPIFCQGWRADEELLLVEGCETLGLGNWEDVANHLGTKTPEECEAHYYQLYLESGEFPLPNPSMVIDEKAWLDAVPVDLKKSPEALPSHPSTHEIQGYMPLRQEFETEYDNEAEHSIKDLCFTKDDSQLDMEIKFSMLEHYNDVLDRRAWKKQFVFDHDLLDFKTHLCIDKNRTREARDLYSRLQMFRRFLHKTDFEQLYQGFMEQLRLQKTIGILQECRRQGIRDIEVTGMDRDEVWLDQMQPHSLKTAELEGAGFLSQQEKTFCASLKLLPDVYLKIKETLVSFCHRHGYLTLAQTMSLLKMDVNRTAKIYGFFVSAGWIPQNESE